jgi:hypothetical protein
MQLATLALMWDVYRDAKTFPDEPAAGNAASRTRVPRSLSFRLPPAPPALAVGASRRNLLQGLPPPPPPTFGRQLSTVTSADGDEEERLGACSPWRACVRTLRADEIEDEDLLELFPVLPKPSGGWRRSHSSRSHGDAPGRRARTRRAGDACSAGTAAHAAGRAR